MRSGNAAMIARRSLSLIVAQQAISSIAATADAQPCLGVEEAKVDARRFQGSAG